MKSIYEEMKFEDGKYEVVFDERGLPQKVLRNGEPWRDLAGDKFMYLVLNKLRELEVWHAEVRRACMITEACYVEGDAKASINNLIDWHIENARYWKEGN